MFTLCPHADNPDEWLVLESILRNYRSPEPKTLEFRDCAFSVRGDVPAMVQTSTTANRSRQAGPSVEELSATVKGWIEGPTKTAELTDRIHKELSVGVGKAKSVLRHLESEGYSRSKTAEFPAVGIITPPPGSLVQGVLPFGQQTGQTGRVE